jgi:hypothetical protein
VPAGGFALRSRAALDTARPASGPVREELAVLEDGECGQLPRQTTVPGSAALSRDQSAAIPLSGRAVVERREASASRWTRCRAFAGTAPWKTRLSALHSPQFKGACEVQFQNSDADAPRERIRLHPPLRSGGGKDMETPDGPQFCHAGTSLRRSAAILARVSGQSLPARAALPQPHGGMLDVAISKDRRDQKPTARPRAGDTCSPAGRDQDVASRPRPKRLPALAPAGRRHPPRRG